MTESSRSLFSRRIARKSLQNSRNSEEEEEEEEEVNGENNKVNKQFKNGGNKEDEGDEEEMKQRIRVEAGDEPLELNLQSSMFYLDLEQLMTILYCSTSGGTCRMNQSFQMEQPTTNLISNQRCLQVTCLPHTSTLHCVQSPLDWMYRVRPAANCFEQNLTAISPNCLQSQIDYRPHHQTPLDNHLTGQQLYPRNRQISLIFRTTRRIAANEELRFWPSLTLLCQLDIPPFLSPSNIVNGRCYLCHRCGTCFTQPNPLKIHLRFECLHSNTRPSSWFAPPIASPSLAQSALFFVTPTAMLRQQQSSSEQNSSLANLKKLQSLLLCSSSRQGPNGLGPPVGSPVETFISPQVPPLLQPLLLGPSTTYERNNNFHLQVEEEVSRVLDSAKNNGGGSGMGGAVNNGNITESGSTSNNNPRTVQHRRKQSETRSTSDERRLKRLHLSKLIFTNGNRHHYSHRHQRHHHHSQSPHNRKLHNCSYCGKVYTRKYGLKIHIRTHTGLKPLSCRFCGRSFSDPSNLNKHVRLHTQQQSRQRENQQQQQQQQMQQRAGTSLS